MVGSGAQQVLSDASVARIPVEDIFFNSVLVLGGGEVLGDG